MENGEWRMENLNFSLFLGVARGNVTTPMKIVITGQWSVQIIFSLHAPLTQV
jgi:hypothetical protein